VPSSCIAIPSLSDSCVKGGLPKATFCESYPQKLSKESTRSRVWVEYLSDKVRKLKDTLGKPAGDPQHDKREVLDLENKLKSWLKRYLSVVAVVRYKRDCH